MKKLRMLGRILRQTNADKILLSYIVFVFIDAFIIFLAEPEITRYFDAVWYCYEVISTTGFGEVLVLTPVGRICSVLLTVYSLIVIAIVTGVVTNYFIQLAELRKKETLTHFMDKLENLPQLSREELSKMSEEVKKFRK